MLQRVLYRRAASTIAACALTIFFYGVEAGSAQTGPAPAECASDVTPCPTGLPLQGRAAGPSAASLSPQGETPEQNAPFTTTINGSITNSDPTQNGRVFRDGLPSTCGANKSYPGTLGEGTPYHHDTYNFTNLSAATACVTVDLTHTCGVNAFAVAYLSDFNPADVSQHYLGDAGQSASPESFSFNVPPGATFIIVVNEVEPGFGCGSYSLTVAGDIAPSPLTISEFTARGPLGALDEFVEVSNNTDTDHVVSPPDGSGGYSIAAEDGVPRCTIPNGTVIPARGHFLCAGAQYSYANDAAPDAFFETPSPGFGDIGDSQGIALFSTNDPEHYGPGAKLDAFGYTTSPALYREGAGFPYVVVANAPRAYVRTQYNTYEKDTGDNGADFISVNARLDVCCDPNSVLGMAGPQNLASPRLRLGQQPVTLFDPNVSASTAPNRERSAVVVPNGQNGTLRFRRTITNNTASPVTRLRIRVVDITTLNTPTSPQPGRPTPCTEPCADLRVLSSSDEAAVATSTGPKPTSGTTLEFGAFQPLGGGHNSSLNVNQVPVAPGGSVNVNMLLGIQRGGAARFFFFVEATP